MIETTFSLNFEKLNNYYYNLLKEEDFDFKNKNIHFDIKLKDKIIVNFSGKNILDLKIATNALIKSLEIINKTSKI